MRLRYNALRFLCTPSILFAFAIHSARADTTIVAKTGNSAPANSGTDGTFLSFIGEPILSNEFDPEDTDVVFRANLAGTSGGVNNDAGIFRFGLSSSTLRQAAREGQGLVNGSGTLQSGTFSGNPFIGGSLGDVVFVGGLTGTAGGTTDDTGIFLGSGSSVRAVLREGQNLPAAVGPGRFGNFATGGLVSLTGVNLVAFEAPLTGTAGGAADDLGIFRGFISGSAPTQLAREGQAVSATDASRFVDFTALQDGGNGGVVFVATLANTPGGTTDNAGVFRVSSSGTITQLAREGDDAPNGNGTLNSFTSFRTNGASNAAFFSQLANTVGGTGIDDEGIFTASGTVTNQIVRRGQPAPDNNGKLDPRAQLLFNNFGEVLFGSSVIETAGGASDDDGLFRGSGGVLTQIAREGQNSPDANGRIGPFAGFAFNERGQVAYKASLTGTTGGVVDDNAIFLANGIDTIILAREGQPMAGSTIVSLGLLDDSLADKDTRSPLNDFGHVAFSAGLANGQSVIALWTLPQSHWVQENGSWNTATNWSQNTRPDSFSDVFLDPVDGAEITASTTNEHINSLTIGDPSGRGIVRLNLTTGDSLTAFGEDVIVNANGHLHLANGSTLNVLSTFLENHGLITGDGDINAHLNNEPTGIVRVSQGEHLRFGRSIGSGPIEGKLEVLGGTLEFVHSLPNFGEISIIGGTLKTNASFNNGSVSNPSGVVIGRDATLRMVSGMTNNGSMAFSFGTSDIFGDINNAAGGRIVVSGGSRATFYDDITNGGIIQVSAAGDLRSSAVFFGSLNGNGVVGGGTVFIEGDLRPGFSPAIVSFGGDLFFSPTSSLSIELGGPTPGTQHDQLRVAGAATLDGTLEVMFIDGFESVAGDCFSIVTGGRVSGRFANAASSLSSSGHFFAVDYAENSATLIDMTATDIVASALVRRNGKLAAIRRAIIAGRNTPPGGAADGRWDGATGIRSSLAAEAFAQDGTEDLSVGYGLNSDLLFPFTTFAGEAVGPNDVLVRLTRNGDASLDGKVDDNDVSLLGGFYNPNHDLNGPDGPRHWYQGDFNFNGRVDDNDASVIGGFYNPSAPPLAAEPAQGVVAVPEPSVLLALGGLWLARRRIEYRP